MSDYNSIWNSMEDDIAYTATELGVAAASLTAMSKRGLVEVIKGKPNRYKKKSSVLPKILSILSQEQPEFFTLYSDKNSIGMLCSLKKNQIVDCWGNPYSIDGIKFMTIKRKEYEL